MAIFNSYVKLPEGTQNGSSGEFLRPKKKDGGDSLIYGGPADLKNMVATSNLPSSNSTYSYGKWTIDDLPIKHHDLSYSSITTWHWRKSRVYLSPPLNHSFRRPYMWVFSIPRYQIQAVWRGFSTFFCQRSKRQIICQQHFWGFYISLSHLNRYFCWTSIYSSIYTYIDVFVDICICRVWGVAKPSAVNPFLKDSEDMWWLAWYGGCTWIIQQLSHFDAPVTSIECFILQPSPGIMIPTFAFLFLGIDWLISKWGGSTTKQFITVSSDVRISFQESILHASKESVPSQNGLSHLGVALDNSLKLSSLSLFQWM